MASGGGERAGDAPRPLRVAFDVTPELFAATGVARYSRELALALERRPDCSLRRIAFGRQTHPLPPRTVHLRIPLRAVHLAWGTLGVPRAESLSGPVDVVHSVDLLAPPTRRPLVVTMHDVVALERPDLHHRRSAALQRSRLAALSRANVVLCVSQATASKLVARGIDPTRIRVVPNGLTALPPPVRVELPPGAFVLAVGTLEPRKGHEVLLRAFASPKLDGYRLVFAGPTAGRAPALASLARELGLGARLTILGAVDDAVLAGLYRDAAALCMPSFAEGFGLPVLEAMSLGLPVVASDIEVVREVAADGALLVPPGSPEALAAALERALSDEALRRRLSRLGRARAALFTWDAAARRTVEAYVQAIEAAAAAC